MIFSNSSLKNSNLFFLSFFIITILSSHIFASANKMEILFTANINGILKNCHCGDPSLGGLARIITLVEQKRQSNPNILVIDGGDGFNTYSYPQLNQATIELLSLLQPNIIVPGDQEWVEGSSFLKGYVQQLKTNFLLSNALISEFSVKSSFTLKTISGPDVYFLGYLDRHSFDLIPIPDQIKLSETDFRSNYKDIPAEDYLIVIYHGPEKALDQFAAKYPNINLILLAHAQSERLSVTQSPAIIGAGSDGEYLRQIAIDFRTNRVTIEVQAIPVNLDIKPNSDALKIIKKWKIR